MSYAQEERSEKVLEEMSQKADVAAQPHRDRIKTLEVQIQALQDQIANEKQSIADIYEPYGKVLMKD